MSKFSGRIAPLRLVVRVLVSALAVMFIAGPTTQSFAQTVHDDGTPLLFVPGNLVVVVEGCGVNGGTCTSVPNGTGTGTLNSSVGGYGDNQGAPITLFQFTPNATASAAYVNSLVLPQTGSGANLPIAGEYGSSSEGGLQLSGTGQYLTLGTYGINAAVFNASAAAAVNTYGAAPSYALAQSGSLTGQSYTPVARIITLVDPYGNVNSASPVFNIFNTNNPRSIYTTNGTTAYLSGQGSGSDATGGVFIAPIGVTTTAPTAITGLDTTTNTLSQDTRFVTVFNNTLYVSVDSKQGSGSTRSYVGTLGTPPATSLYSSNAGPTEMLLANNATSPVAVTSNGQVSLTASEVNTVNTASVGKTVNISPSGYFFANLYTLYIADTGNSKQTSGKSLYGDGGLQKWINTKTDGTGTWELMYTMSLGLNLVANTNAVASDTTGSTGLYALTGVVSGTNVYLYATNATLSDLDQTYLYGITDPIAATTNPGTAFAVLATAPPDSNFKGVAFAPTLPAGSATINTVPEGLQVTTAGTGCAPGSYVTPVTLIWTPGNSCTLSVTRGETAAGAGYLFTNWQDNTTATSDVVTAPASSAIYTATFTTSYAPFGSLDQAADSSTGTSTVSQADDVHFFGWAVDPIDGAPMSNVKAYIDGTLEGTATVGYSRPDVASAYNNAAYTNSGYYFNYLASSLSIGTHAATVIATDSTGKSVALGPLSFTVAAATPKPPLVYIDQPPTNTVIGQNSNLSISGWAGDPQNGAALTSLTVSIDGKSAGAATTGIARPDVVTATGNNAYANSGYTFTQSASALTIGQHTVTVTGTDTLGLSTTSTPVTINVVVNAQPIGNLDLAVDSGTGSSNVASGDLIYISGWAADYYDNGAAKSVQIIIDGNAAGSATLGQSRSDVANAYSNPAWSTTGFVTTVPASTLSTGTHIIGVLATDSTGHASSFNTKTITITP